MFSKPTSVFKDWNVETIDKVNKGFDLDAQFLKLPKFIKDEVDLKNTLAVLKTHFFNLRQQYVCQICTPKYYPCISWLEFTNITNSWKIVGKGLTQTDVDRIFIATNYEEVDLDNNDDSNLCRYELLEIICRMAKCKYVDSLKETNSVAEATEKLI